MSKAKRLNPALDGYISSEPMPIVYIQTGSNQGDRLAHLNMARSYIEDVAGTVIQASRIFKTAAWGVEEQPDFLNQVLEVRTELEPETLLDTVLNIELEMGRVRIQKWGQRLIDIDLLYYDKLIIKSEKLTLPHPYLQERNFVLYPLNDIAPQLVHPILKKTTRELMKASQDTLPATPYEPE